jgi:hypothetical protein
MYAWHLSNDDEFYIKEPAFINFFMPDMTLVEKKKYLQFCTIYTVLVYM